jgi:hypothetical protein
MSEEAPQNNIVSVVLVLGCLLWFGALLLPALGSPRRGGSNQMKNSANLRGIDQSMVIFGNSNNDYLPGLSNNGTILTSSVQSHGTAQSGAAFHARLWILLNGQYIGGDLITNPQDSLSKWVTGQNCTSANTSYAGLQIGSTQNAIDTTRHEGRASEWKNNANSQAIMFSDRLYIPSNIADNSVQSVWTSSRGDWKGNLVWGDNHAEFQQTHKGFTTRYLATTETNDNLFATQSSPGVSEEPAATGNSTSNAMMIYF